MVVYEFHDITNVAVQSLADLTNASAALGILGYVKSKQKPANKVR